jgi:hypothetical protein
MNTKLKVRDALSGLWHLSWRVWAWSAFMVTVGVSDLRDLLHAKTFASAAAHGGLLLLCGWVALLGPGMLGMTLPQQYTLARAGGLTRTYVQRTLYVVGVGLMLLALVYWLSSR